MAARSRYVEDRLAEAVAGGVRQYAILGAGLDTFAYRNPFPELQVFEVDFPATQEWKRAMLAESGIALPANLTFVPLDFEHKALGEGLGEAGFDDGQAAFFWMAGGGALSYTRCISRYAGRCGGVAGRDRGGFRLRAGSEDAGADRARGIQGSGGPGCRAGEPFQLFFTPETMALELAWAGFQRIEQLDSDDLNERYFKDRADGLKLSSVKLGMLATAWV